MAVQHTLTLVTRDAHFGGIPDLALEICRTIKARKLTQQAAAKLMGIDQPKVSHVLTGRLAGYSTERLVGFLTALGRDIEIVVCPAPRLRRQGRRR